MVSRVEDSFLLGAEEMEPEPLTGDRGEVCLGAGIPTRIAQATGNRSLMDEVTKHAKKPMIGITTKKTMPCLHLPPWPGVATALHP